MVKPVAGKKMKASKQTDLQEDDDEFDEFEVVDDLEVDEEPLQRKLHKKRASGKAGSSFIPKTKKV
ncbi:hypothetical protein D3C72_2542330 [compost metagenome]